MEMSDYEKEHLARLHDSLAECMVLLKRDDNFPLLSPCRIAAYGNGVRGTRKGGTGSGEVNSRFFVNVEDGLKNAGFEVTTENWLSAYEEKNKQAFKEFVKVVKKEAKAMHMNAVVYGMGKVMPEPEYDLPLDAEGDAAVYVLARICGEGNDRQNIPGDIQLTKTEIRDILALNAKYPRFMLVLNVGGPVDLSPVNDQVRNILILSQLGVETGNALAEVLLGKQNPSGKLTTTWSAWKDYCPDIDFGSMDDTYYKEGIYVGYRYFDTIGRKPLYPFGYGLSYTEFAVRGGEVDLTDTQITAKVKVENMGKVPGKEVVQLYVTAPDGKLDKPYQELAGFAKTKCLQPGETGEADIVFDLRSLASYDEDTASYILEKGDYLLRLGTSSADTEVVAAVELDGTAVVRKVRNITGKAGIQEIKYARPAVEFPQGTPAFRLSAADIQCEEAVYDVPGEILPEVKMLTDEELAYLNVGAFSDGGGVFSIIGSASASVPGAAGETTGNLRDKKIPAIVMADGPAGLRLTKEFYRDKKGVHQLNQSNVPESMMAFLPGIAAVIMKMISGGKKEAPAGAQVEYQYMTAVPIGTGIAQSWNTEFAEVCGDIVGDEMVRVGVHCWLAPALNIHRSIRCGRNFEYYSEDPLVAGKFAAAVARGVQQHPGRIVTIKHYAANNQETNRMNSNSLVSERAMREIYLKGFGICVRESQPGAVMTSYNLLNGTHTSEHKGLIMDYLRAENGFRGIVMTDWVIGMASWSKNPKWRNPDAGLVAAAGGDVFMPGCKKDWTEVLTALKDGRLTREQLEENASRVISMARKLNGTV